MTVRVRSVYKSVRAHNIDTSPQLKTLIYLVVHSAVAIEFDKTRKTHDGWKFDTAASAHMIAI